ncbi:hypothetical protein M407DRAFT_29595 [Tulasnella calospora MUT 4182]|uniref:Uncharacterized protein n=1 Tax=Tulasnella calospora MUT 4182 TaxID=1051891 RepID=A0A0C3KH12_9AGAM|nr:hypothetical protein M407DRAFT_29595 [Tulasnella calospora MUT 4182]
MLSKLFRSRQSTASRQPPFQLGPTPDQPTDPKPPSNLARKLKEFKNALRPSRLTKKGIGMSLTVPTTGNDTHAIDDTRLTIKLVRVLEEATNLILRMRLSWGNLAPGPFTAEDYEFRHGSPISNHQDLVPSFPSTEGSSGTGAPSIRSSSDFATNPPSTRLASTLATPVNAPLQPQHPVSTPQVESKVLAARKVRRDDAQEVPALRSRPALTPVPWTTAVTQNHTLDVSARQPIEEYLLPEAPVCAKTGKNQVEKQSKWWEMGGSVKTHKRHFRRDAVDYGNPNSDYCNVEEFGEKARSLKRGGANKWRQPLQRRHSSKQVRRSKKASEDEPILRDQTGEPTPVSTTTDGFKFHGRTLSSTSTGAAQGPLSPARLPLGTLNLSLVLGGEAQASLEAGAVKDSSSEHGDISSQGTGAEDAITEASFWLGRIIFPRRQSPGPAQH